MARESRSPPMDRRPSWLCPARTGARRAARSISSRASDVVFSVPVASRAVAAGILNGRAYVFDDKIGYFLDAATGRPVPRTFTVDNYRGLYMADGVEHVQTTFEVAFVGSPGPPFQAVGMPFGAVVDGCLVASAGAG